ncbi:hypothetical protein [Providencia rettgeri]|uniref:hypothetical protein n=1 Tax=Providencia rettgeri TaxID=587 RepID=UPI00141965C9|nr:hypothetical protein [Providencia rettgeri]NIH07168.1 hypothetical protein [Providencia rettgeri]
MLNEEIIASEISIDQIRILADSIDLPHEEALLLATKVSNAKNHLELDNIAHKLEVEYITNVRFWMRISFALSGVAVICGVLTPSFAIAVHNNQDKDSTYTSRLLDGQYSATIFTAITTVILGGGAAFIKDRKELKGKATLEKQKLFLSYLIPLIKRDKSWKEHFANTNIISIEKSNPDIPSAVIVSKVPSVSSITTFRQHTHF